MKYKVCEYCGAHLDPDEHCDCRENADGPDGTGLATGRILRHLSPVDRQAGVVQKHDYAGVVS